MVQTLVSFVEKTFGWGPFEGGIVFLLLAIPALFDPVFGRRSRSLSIDQQTLTCTQET